MTAFSTCVHSAIVGEFCAKCTHESYMEHWRKLESRVSRLERIVKASLSESPVVSEEIKEL
jgi:hypothetical protein